MKKFSKGIVIIFIIMVLTTSANASEPDLIITSFGLKKWGVCKPNHTVMTFQVVVKNIGNAISPNILDKAMISVKDQDGSGWGNGVTIGPIAPNNSKSVEIPVYFFQSNPQHMIEKMHPFRAIVDPLNLINESNEHNNLSKIIKIKKLKNCYIPLNSSPKDEFTLKLHYSPYSHCCGKIGNDKDCDGLIDKAEEQIAYAIRPYLVMDAHEKCGDNMVLLYQLTPISKRKLEFIIVLLFKEDCPDKYKRKHKIKILQANWFSRHHGDSEKIKGIIEARDKEGKEWILTSLQFKNKKWTIHSRNKNAEWSPKMHDGFRHIKVYISRGKHGLYPSKRICVNSWHAGSKEHCGGKDIGLPIFGYRLNFKRGEFLRSLNVKKPIGNIGEPPHHFLLSDLTAYGFPNESITSFKCFCGGRDRPNRCKHITKTPRNCCKHNSKTGLGPYHCADPVRLKLKNYQGSKLPFCEE